MVTLFCLSLDLKSNSCTTLYTGLYTQELSVHYDIITVHYDIITVHYDIITVHYDIITVHYDIITVHYDIIQVTGHDSAVLDSYVKFVGMAAKGLEIEMARR